MTHTPLTNHEAYTIVLDDFKRTWPELNIETLNDLSCGSRIGVLMAVGALIEAGVLNRRCPDVL